MFYNSSKNIIAILTIIVFALAGCGDDSSNADKLDGDLSFEVTGESGIDLVISVTEATDNSASFSTVDNVTTPAEGDLDDGDFKGYVLQASPVGLGDEPDITLKLLSDGDVVEETSSATDDGVFLIEIGDVPDFSNFN